MADNWWDGVGVFLKAHHLGWLAALAGPSGAAIVGTRYAVARLKPDQQSFIIVLEEIDASSNALDEIVGREDSREKDCDRCRCAMSARRRAGQEIQTMFPGARFDPFRSRLRSFDLTMREVEDLVHAANRKSEQVRQACEAARGILDELRLSFRHRAERRLSVRVHGRRNSK